MHICIYVCTYTPTFISVAMIKNTLMKSKLGKKRLIQLKITGFSPVHHCGAVKAEPETDCNTHGQGQGEPNAIPPTAQPTFSILNCKTLPVIQGLSSQLS